MRIAFCLFKYFPYGGLQRDFLKIALECLRRGHKVNAYVMEWQGDIPEGLQVHYVEARGLSNHQKCRSYGEEVQKKIKALRYDCVVGFNKIPGLDVYYAADGCFQARAREAHKPWYRWSPRYRTYQQLEQAVFAKEGHCQILLLNEREKAKFIDYYHTPNDRFHLVPPGISEDRVATTDAELIAREVRDEFVVVKGDKLLLMVATDFKTKGLVRAIAALAALPQALRLKTHLFVIGQDNPQPYLAQAQKLGVRDRLMFLGARDDVGRFLLAADLLIHPAITENAGMVLLEALACGLPVLTTENCGYASHVQAARAGIIVPMPFQQGQLDAELMAMLTSDQLATWRANALDYITRTDIFSLAPEAANIIEKVVA